MKHFNRSACFNDISNKQGLDERSFTSISTKFGFDSTEVISEASSNVTAHFQLLTNNSKRSRDGVISSESKKSNGFHAPVTKLITELYDSETMTSTSFRCFYEKDVIGIQGVSLGFIQNECDDDCPTDNLQVDTCTEFLLKDLESALINFRN
jgi:hypothetical protein